MKSKGFTLIELLVVIAIIGMLSSIVFASLNSARVKAKRSALKEELVQFRTLMALEFSDKGSYAGLASQNGWANNPVHQWAGTCDQMYPLGSNASAYIPQANALCKKIIEVSSGGSYALYVTANSESFSAESWFASDGLLYCVGSSGVTFMYSGYIQSVGVTACSVWTDTCHPYFNKGCSSNP